MNDRLEQRLRELSIDELIALLLSVAGTSKKMAKLVMTAASTHKERVASVKRGIIQLGQYGSSRQRVYARDVAAKIGDLHRQLISIADHDLGMAFELMCKLLERENVVHSHVDDSYGVITDEFRGAIVPSLVAMSQRVSDPKTLLKGLRYICEHDEYGTMAIALQQIAEFLPDKVAETLIKELAARPLAAPRESGRRWDANVEMRKAIHAGRGEVDAYIKAAEQLGEVRESDFVVIATIYLELDDLKGAATYLGKISELTFQMSIEAKQLRHRWMMNYADAPTVEMYCRNEILNYPTDEKIDEYRRRFGDDALQVVLDEAVALEAARQQSDGGNEHICMALIKAGCVVDIASIIEQHLKHPWGYVRSWRQLAEVLTTHGQHRAAAILCRRLLDMMLAKADTGTYAEAAEVYHLLAHYSSTVTDWGSHPSPKEYSDAFHQQHDRKKSLWERINSPAPPKRSPLRRGL